MGTSRNCDICGRTDPRGRIVSFSLRREVFEPRPDKSRYHYTLSAGAIDLCRTCWGRIGQPRQRPARRKAPINVESLFDA